jgi:hypothetical protein
MRIPSLVDRLLASAPEAGSGLHSWLIKGANECRKAGVTPERAFDLIAQTVVARGGRVLGNEIRKAIRKAYSQSHNGTYTPAPTWPGGDLGLIESLTTDATGAVDELRGLSPENPDQRTGDIISRLFPPDALVCAGMDERATTTFELSRVRERLHRFQFIVPSPMSSRLGLTQEGKESGRCLGNVGPRRFLVTEFDFKRLNDNGSPSKWAPLIDQWEAAGATVQDACAAIILNLKQFGPLAMVVFSGGKSLHAWWYCDGEDESEGSRLHKFMAYACRLGADPRTYTRSQFVRMPGATRQDGRKQPVHYLDTTLTNNERN